MHTTLLLKAAAVTLALGTAVRGADLHPDIMNSSGLCNFPCIRPMTITYSIEGQTGPGSSGSAMNITPFGAWTTLTEQGYSGDWLSYQDSGKGGQWPQTDVTVDFTVSYMLDSSYVFNYLAIYALADDFSTINVAPTAFNADLPGHPFQLVAGSPCSVNAPGCADGELYGPASSAGLPSADYTTFQSDGRSGTGTIRFKVQQLQANTPFGLAFDIHADTPREGITPEPGTALLFVGGFAFLAGVARRSRRRGA